MPANAVINRGFLGTGSIIISGPAGLRQNESLLQAAAANGDTMALFLAMREFEDLVPLLSRHYSATTPVALVYSAGIADSEKLVHTTLQQAGEEVRRHAEKNLGMIYIGPRLAKGGVAECH
jgi:precorrin-4 methylase